MNNLSNKAKMAIALTAGIFICTFISWGTFKYQVGGAEISILTMSGWEGSISRYDMKFYNWLFSVCALSVGGIATGAALGLNENKLKYIAGQLCFLIAYIVTFFNLLNDGLEFEVGPGIPLISVAVFWLTRYYLKGFNRSNTIAQQ